VCAAEQHPRGDRPDEPYIDSAPTATAAGQKDQAPPDLKYYPPIANVVGTSCRLFGRDHGDATQVRQQTIPREKRDATFVAVWKHWPSRTAIAMPLAAQARRVQIPTGRPVGAARPASTTVGPPPSSQRQGRRAVTEEFQDIFEAKPEETGEGGQAPKPDYTCLPDGMPRGYERNLHDGDVITPATTLHPHRIPDDVPPHSTPWPANPRGHRHRLNGLLVGKWVDTKVTGASTRCKSRRLPQSPRAKIRADPAPPGRQDHVKRAVLPGPRQPDVLHDEVHHHQTTPDPACDRHKINPSAQTRSGSRHLPRRTTTTSPLAART